MLLQRLGPLFARESGSEDVDGATRYGRLESSNHLLSVFAKFSRLHAEAQMHSMSIFGRCTVGRRRKTLAAWIATSQIDLRS